MTATVGLILLAAGGSSRLGQPKQLLEYGGQTLLYHAVETAIASQCHPSVVVLGAQADRLRMELTGLDPLIAENPDWERGMGSSLRVGLAALERAAPDLSGVVLMLCDQPLVTAASLDALLQAHQETGCSLIASEYAGTHGVPAFFSRTLFPELRTLPDMQGAKAIIDRHRLEAVCLPLPTGAWDIDTERDYERLRSLP